MVVRPDSAERHGLHHGRRYPSPAYPQFEPRASPDDSDDSSDDDGVNLEGDDYQYNGGGYEDYEYAYYTPRQEYD